MEVSRVEDQDLHQHLLVDVVVKHLASSAPRVGTIEAMDAGAAGDRGAE